VSAREDRYGDVVITMLIRDVLRRRVACAVAGSGGRASPWSVQSELLAVESLAVLAIFLRQRGSPESKRVGDEHAVTADSG
jgi:hypothetical protein